MGNGPAPDATGGPPAAHPHGRGERGRPPAVARLEQGSPPRAWGTASPGCCTGCSRRLTPTGVGNGRKDLRRSPGPTAHPHGRGERWAISASSFCTRGSPPRAWGTDAEKKVSLAAFRLTPTGVGNGSHPQSPTPSSAAHPHGRGERAPVAPQPNADRGSPPRAWGTVRMIARRPGDKRLTPTGVGNGTPCARRCRTRSAHPHGRGERRAYPNLGSNQSGSPPRAWGTGGRGVHAPRRDRLTPTGVGNGARPPRPAGDPAGSPPRAWGTGVHVRQDPRVIRLTPTGVGNGSATRSFDWAVTAHPHGRGERTGRPPPAIVDTGSPPRAWGTDLLTCSKTGDLGLSSVSVFVGVDGRRPRTGGHG